MWGWSPNFLIELNLGRTKKWGAYFHTYLQKVAKSIQKHHKRGPNKLHGWVFFCNAMVAKFGVHYSGMHLYTKHSDFLSSQKMENLDSLLVHAPQPRLRIQVHARECGGIGYIKYLLMLSYSTDQLIIKSQW